MENDKFELLLDDTITRFGKKMYRIRALRDFGDVKAGELGGYVEKEENLAVTGNAWVYGNAEVYGNAKVYGNARVSGNAEVSGDARVYGNAEVYGNAVVESSADYIVFKNNWSSFRYFTYTKSNRLWRVGCFLGTGTELIEKAYQDSQQSGDNYKLYVELVRAMEGDS